MNSRKSGIILSYGYFILSTIITIFLSSFVIRTIGKTEYGIYQSVAAFIGYLTLLEFGTGRIMSRNLSLLKKDGTDAEEIKKHVSTVYILNCILTVVILCFSVVFWLLLDVLYKHSMTPEQIHLAKIIFLFPVINLITSFFQQMLNGALIGYENYTFEKIISIIKIIVRTAIVVAVLLVQSSIVLYVIVDTTINILALVVTVCFCVFKLKMPLSWGFFDKKIFKLITPLCFAMLLQSLVTTMNGTLDKFLISIMMSPEDVTVYSIAMTIYSMFSTIACLPISMYMPQVATNMKNGLKGQALTETLVQPTRLNVIITGIVAFGFTVAGRQFISILYGSDFLASWLYAMVVIFPMFFNAFNDIILNVLDVLRKRHIRSVILMLTTTLNFVMTILGIRYIGMFGAALATGIATMIQVVILNIYYYVSIGINTPYLFKHGFKGTLPSFLVATIPAVLLLLLIDNQYVSFLLCGITFIIAFIIVFYCFGSNSYEKNNLKRVFCKFIKQNQGEQL